MPSKQHHSHRPHRVHMYDDVDLDLIPPHAKAVAGYVGGRFTTFPEVLRRWPQAHHLSIAVNAGEVARFLDVEFLDATISQAPGWFRMVEPGHGRLKPGFYISLASAESLVDHLASFSIRLNDDYKLWTAHWTGVPHICDPSCGFGFTHRANLTQYTNRAHGHSLDESLVGAHVFAHGHHHHHHRPHK